MGLHNNVASDHISRITYRSLTGKKNIASPSTKDDGIFQDNQESIGCVLSVTLNIT